METLQDMHWTAQLGIYASLLITIATAITAVFPSVSENKIYNIAMKVLNFIAGNFGKNKNADAEKK